MADVLMLAITAGFFLMCVGYVKVCDRIIGPDPIEVAEVESRSTAPEEVAA